MSKHQVVLIPGDGIGPEVTEAVKRILAAAKAPVDWLEYQAGPVGRAARQGPAARRSARGHSHASRGAEGAVYDARRRGFYVDQRLDAEETQALRCGAARADLDGVTTRYQNVDLVIIRENTEGLYSGVENQVTDGVVMSMKVATEAACLRIARFAFQFAVRRQQKKVTAMHKANIMKLTDGLFLRCPGRSTSGVLAGAVQRGDR